MAAVRHGFDTCLLWKIEKIWWMFSRGFMAKDSFNNSFEQPV